MLALIARGLTNAQIADELYLSIETVKTYVKRLYAKLDVHNRAQAAVGRPSSHQLDPAATPVIGGLDSQRRSDVARHHVSASCRPDGRPVRRRLTP